MSDEKKDPIKSVTSAPASAAVTTGPKDGPAPGQRPQTTGEPNRTTVAQKDPEKVKENDGVQKVKNEFPTGQELQDKLDELAEQTAKALNSLGANGVEVFRDDFVRRLRRTRVGAAPLRHTSGGNTVEGIERAKEKAGDTVPPGAGSF